MAPAGVRRRAPGPLQAVNTSYVGIIPYGQAGAGAVNEHSHSSNNNYGLGDGRPITQRAAVASLGSNLPVPGRGREGIGAPPSTHQGGTNDGFPSVDAPSRQGKTAGSLLRVVGCCHPSGLRCGRNTAAGLVGVRGPGPDHPKRARGTVESPGCPSPVSPLLRHTLLPFALTSSRSWAV